MLLCQGLHEGFLSCVPSPSILAVHIKAGLSTKELPDSVSPWEGPPLAALALIWPQPWQTDLPVREWLLSGPWYIPPLSNTPHAHAPPLLVTLCAESHPPLPAQGETETVPHPVLNISGALFPLGHIAQVN